MHLLYALQQRLAITSMESSALLFVFVLLLTGFCVRYVQGQAVPFSAEQYAALDSTFAARAAPPEVATADSTDADEPDEAAPAAVEREPRTPRRPANAGPVRMNLNTASEQQLQRLPRIGPKIAERIVAYRDAHGDFERPRDVTRVKGIGPKTFEKLAPYLYVDEAAEAADGS